MTGMPGDETVQLLQQQMSRVGSTAARHAGCKRRRAGGDIGRGMLGEGRGGRGGQGEI